MQTQATKPVTKTKVYVLLGLTLLGTTTMLATANKAEAASYTKVYCCKYCVPVNSHRPVFIW